MPLSPCQLSTTPESPFPLLRCPLQMPPLLKSWFLHSEHFCPCRGPQLPPDSLCLVTDTSAVPFDQSYHLLELRNNGGLMIPSKGTVKVVRAAERAIRQHSPGKAPDEVVVAHFVREEIGTEDVFALGSHVQESQFGIDNHLSLLLSLVVSVFCEYGCIISPN
ncbi:unnamed protein product [Gadus morhua 'NCC']